MSFLGSISKDNEDKITYWKRAIAECSDCFSVDGEQIGPVARLELGRLYLQLGKKDEAKQLFDEIRRDYPDALDMRSKLPVAELAQRELNGSQGAPGGKEQEKPARP